MKPRSQTPLPHRLPSDPASERVTPMLPPDEAPRQCPECEGEGFVSIVTVDSDSRQDCECCLGTGNITPASYEMWVRGFR